jgi:undecaprenyl diphosphate synthase
MQSDKTPSHVAVIMDGNRRWAGKRFLPVGLGHAGGAKAIRGFVRACSERGIKYLTLFAFSTENWKRPAEEVSSLMRLLVLYLQKEVADMNANGVRLQVIGDISRFDARLQGLIKQAHELTAHNTTIVLTVAVNYGGRWDMLQAAKAWQASNPDRPIADMDEEGLQAHLCMAGLPDPDLLIRTGGESRISNFLLWQMAYTEFYFTDTLWPDFNAIELEKALVSFAQRDRRFGTSSEIAPILGADSSDNDPRHFLAI